MTEFSPIAGADRRPLHMQTIEALQKMIENGRLKPGDKLPPEAALAESLGISRATLREALGHLESNGLISRRQGVGTFITVPFGSGVRAGLALLEPFRNVARRAGLKSKIVFRQVSKIVATEALAEPLEIDLGTDLIRVQIVEAVNDSRCMYLDNYIPLQDSEEQELQYFQGSVLEYLQEEIDPPLSHTQTEIFSIAADDEIAKFLEVEPGAPILHNFETYISTEGSKLGIGRVYFLTDHFHFFITRRAG
jgi:GntR family transcriptional regulator